MLKPAPLKTDVAVEIVGMHKWFAEFHVLRDINLKVSKGEFITLIGHSGCGKSTLLNLIAGLTTPTSGVLLCDGREIAEPGPEFIPDHDRLRLRRL